MLQAQALNRFLPTATKFSCETFLPQFVSKGSSITLGEENFFPSLKALSRPPSEVPLAGSDSQGTLVQCSTGRCLWPGQSPRQRRRRARRRSGSSCGTPASRSPPWPPSCGRSCTPAMGGGSPGKCHRQLLQILTDRENAILCEKISIPLQVTSV